MSQSPRSNSDPNSQSNSQSNSDPDLVITSFTTDRTTTLASAVIVEQQGTNAAGSVVTHSTFTTTDPAAVPQVAENLVAHVVVYEDSPNKALLDEIKACAAEIKCEDFHGKGTIEDYSALFQAASNIANQSKQMQLDMDVAGFDEFGQAADELSALFSGFVLKLQNVNIINDTSFLQSIVSSLRKIVNLSNVFGEFKETILATSVLKLPVSAQETKRAVEGVMAELNCAMGYINYFVGAGAAPGEAAELSAHDKEVVSGAVHTINSWNALCDQGVSIALSSNADLQYMRSANQELLQKKSVLANAASILRARFPNGF